MCDVQAPLNASGSAEHRGLACPALHLEHHLPLLWLLSQHHFYFNQQIKSARKIALPPKQCEVNFFRWFQQNQRPSRPQDPVNHQMCGYASIFVSSCLCTSTPSLLRTRLGASLLLPKRSIGTTTQRAPCEHAPSRMLWDNFGGLWLTRITYIRHHHPKHQSLSDPCLSHPGLHPVGYESIRRWTQCV